MLVIYVPFTAISENRQAFGGQTAYLHPRGVIYRSNENDNCYMSLLCILFHSRQRNEWTLTRRTSPGMMTSLLLRPSEACRVKTILDLNYTKYVLLTTLESGSKCTVNMGFSCCVLVQSTLPLYFTVAKLRHDLHAMQCHASRESSNTPNRFLLQKMR